jgi:hypothetical protein
LTLQLNFALKVRKWTGEAYFSGDEVDEVDFLVLGVEDGLGIHC